MTRYRTVRAIIDVAIWPCIGIFAAAIIGCGVYLLIWLTRGGFWT